MVQSLLGSLKKVKHEEKSTKLTNIYAGMDDMDPEKQSMADIFLFKVSYNFFFTWKYLSELNFKDIRKWKKYILNSYNGNRNTN
jgi:hypothetical protein